MNLEVDVSAPAVGKAISSFDIEKGLRELNPDIHFDMPNNLEDANFVMHGVPDFERINSNRQGIYWYGSYIYGMDRGISTEFPVWEMEDGIQEIPPSQSHLYDDGVCTYVQILPTDSFYHAALTKAQAKDDNFTIGDAGQVYKWVYFRMAKVRGRIIRVGWRSTMEALTLAGIPGVTRLSLEKKFGIDLSFNLARVNAGSAFTEG